MKKAILWGALLCAALAAVLLLVPGKKAASPAAAETMSAADGAAIAWPGGADVTISDLKFLSESSGLDCADGKLYAVDNGAGTFWVLNIAEDGSLTFADGFKNGKRVRYADGTGTPDAEGIAADDSGFVYLAAERDLDDPGVNSDVILKVDPAASGSKLTAAAQWDLTASLPQVEANRGIEGLKWAAGGEAAGKLFDRNTGAPYDPAVYPDADGVFFAALEANGHVYAYALNADGTAVQLADLDSGLGGAMALDYDRTEHVLWVKADNGFGNRSARLTLNGTAAPSVVFVEPPAGLDAAANYEGFAVSDAVRNGRRAVYFFEDGPSSGALAIGSLDA